MAQDLASSDPARLDPEHLQLSVREIRVAADRASTLTAQLLAIGRLHKVTALASRCGGA